MNKIALNKLHVLRLAVKYGCIKRGRLNIVGCFESPGSNPTGLCYDGRYVWHCDADQARIFKIDVTKEEIICSRDTPFGHPWGLTWDGEFIWISDDFERRIIKMDSSGNIIKSFSYPNMDIHGLAWDGRDIWFVDWISKRIYKINANSGEITGQIPAPSKNPAGLCYHEKFLWHTDSDINVIYKMEPSGRLVGFYKGFKGHSHDICAVNGLLLISVRDQRRIYKVRLLS